MNKTILGLSAAALIGASAFAAPPRMLSSGPTPYEKLVSQQLQSQQRSWKKGTPANPFMSAHQAPAVYPTGTLGPVSNLGNVFTPAGETWWYTMEYGYTETFSIESVHITIYDAQFKKYSDLDIELTLNEGETSINFVQLNPTLSRKFFDIDDNYEIMVFVHATTEDFMGNYYTRAYSLKDGHMIAEYPGNNIGTVNTAQDSWSENFTMIFMREDFGYDGSYTLLFDVYKKANWGTPGATLDHTFAVDYATYSGAGDVALPIIMNNRGSDIFFALPHYEKPFFVDDENYWSDNPTVNLDNKFIIDLYDGNYQLVKTTTIPFDPTPAEALYNFPGVGELMGNNDMIFGFEGNDEWPVYVVSFENYTIAIDEFVSTIKLYDADGNYINTVIEGAYDYLPMSDIAGREPQFCFYLTDGETESYFTFVDVPSCTLGARLDTALEAEGNSLTTTLDRVPYQGSYAYVVSLAAAEVDNAGNALHPIRWFDNDGTVIRTDMVNLGQDIALALPNISQYVLSPYLFNTDSNVEYMFLVKKLISADTSSASREYLRIYSDNKVIFEQGPKDNGSWLNTITVSNADSNDAKLVIVYSGEDGYDIEHYNLPLFKFDGGNGTILDPYVLACAGDVMSIYTEPQAYYIVGNDIDFANEAWDGNNCAFQGVLDGQGHTLSNLNLQGSGIFNSIFGKAKVSNLVIANSTLTSNTNAGFVASEAFGETAQAHTLIDNVKVVDCTIQGNYAEMGSIVGTSYVYGQINGCQATGVNINVDRGVGGGIVGRMQTGSSVTNSAFQGKIMAETAGGICGYTTTGDEQVANCHVNAEIVGRTIGGGILGEADRTKVEHCYAEGSVSATSRERAYAGGIVGVLNPTYEKDPPVIILNNIVALEEIYANATECVAHRIIGLSSGEMLTVDWDHVTGDMTPDQYPYIYGDPEASMAGNYAINLGRVSTDVADFNTTLEGQSIEYNDVTDDFLAARGWKLGQDNDNPWVRGESGLALYFEGKGESGSIGSAVAEPSKAIAYDGATLRAEGLIEVYNAAGLLVAKAHGAVSAADLPKGIYIAVAQGKSLKFAVR